MDDALAVRVGQGAEDVRGDAQRLVERQRARLLQPRLQRLALDVLGGQEGDDVLFVARLEERDEVRMMQRREQLRLALEALVELGAVGVVVEALLRTDDLQRDAPAEPPVAR